jgi:hypothetical protein
MGLGDRTPGRQAHAIPLDLYREDKVLFLGNNVAWGRPSVAHSLVPFWPIWPGSGNDRRKPILSGPLSPTSESSDLKNP